MSVAQSLGRGSRSNSWFQAAGRGVVLAAALMAQWAASCAMAQDSATGDKGGSATQLVAQATAAAPTDQSAQAGAADEQLQEVTVTAERVASSLLTTPIAITSLSTQELTQTNVTTTTDLKGLVPSLNITQVGGYGASQTNVVIRGIGGEPRFFNQDNGVGFYLDDFYVPTGDNLNLDFYDLASTQILEGPQGTLFGRNTLGGALLMTPVAPTNEFGGYAQTSVGNYHRLDSQGALNMPFSDVLAGRFSFYTQDVDGYINDIYDNQTHNDDHEKSARFQLRFQPSAAFTADVFASFGEYHDNGDEEIEVNCNPNGGYVKDYALAHPGQPGYCTQFPPLGQPYTIYGTSTAHFPNPLYSSNANGTLGGLSDLGIPGAGGFTPYTLGRVGTTILHLTGVVNDWLTLKSITGWRYDILDSYRDDGTPAGLYTESNANWYTDWSQEFQGLINVFGGRLNVVAGLYYYGANTVSIQDTGPDYDDPVGYYYANPANQKSYAGYLQATGQVTQKFSIIAGIRYTDDWKNTASRVWEGCYGSYIQEYDEYQTGGPGAYSGGCWIPGPNPNDYASASDEWHHTDPRLQFQYQWTPEFMTYLSATSGYLAGGFNPQLPFFPPKGVPAATYYNQPFQEETVWNYEFGTKGEWFDHRLRVDFAGYDEIFDNYQGRVLEYYTPTGISLTPPGIDVTTTTSAADAHERGVEVTLDAIPIHNLAVELTYSYLTQGYDTIFAGAAASGLTKSAALISAPGETYAFVGSYTFHLGNGATIVPAVNFKYLGTQWYGTYPLQFLGPGYGLLGANLAYNAPNNKWSVSLWGTNILNRYYYQSYAPDTYQDKNMGDSRITPGTPMEWGGTFRWNIQ